MNLSIVHQLTHNIYYNSEDQEKLIKNYLTFIKYIRSANLSIIENEINNTVKQLLQEMMSKSVNDRSYISVIGPIWVLVSVIGLFSNFLVVLVLCGSTSQMVYQVFCVGLAITDLCFLSFGASFTVLHYIFNNWVFGQVLCKFVNYIIYISLYSSSIMLLSLTASRFLAVVHPWKHKQMKTIDAKWACVVAWIIGIILSIPIPIIMTLKKSSDILHLKGNITSTNSNVSNSTPESFPNLVFLSHGHSLKSTEYFCYDDFPNHTLRSIYQIFTTLVTYLIPFSSITIMNSMIVHKLRMKEKNFKISDKENKQRKVRAKVTQLVFTVTTLYCICWLPIQIFNVWFNSFRPYFKFDDSKFQLKMISQTLAYLSSCINPFVYSVMSGFFKESVSARFPRFISRTQRSASSVGESSQMNYTTYTTGQSNKTLRSRNSLPTPIQKKNSFISSSEYIDFVMEKPNRSYSTLI